MKLYKYLGLIYGITVALIIALGTWWVIFLTSEGKNYERYHLQRLVIDQVHAAFLLQLAPELGDDQTSELRNEFPNLIFEETPDGIQALIDPAASEKIRKEAHRRQRMFISEGIFFLLLLGAGTTIIILAYRREREFKSARELFLTGVTHEFKTPMASLQLYAETMARPNLKEADRERVTRGIIDSLHRLETLVDQTLSMSREEHLHTSRSESFDLAQETRSVLDAMKEILNRKQARLELSLPEECVFNGIRSAFALALGNIIQNALLYSPEPARIAVRLVTEGSYHRLSVRDWGPGIPRRYRKKIFQSFFRIKEGRRSDSGNFQGSGLGLFLVKRHMEMLGGKVKVLSPEGGGTEFILFLPAGNAKGEVVA